MIEALSVSDLSRQCIQETLRYRNGEPHADHYCLELYRRAVVERDDDAWAAIVDCYGEIVRNWLGPQYGHDDTVVSVFERFWHAVDTEKFARFASLSAILQYLKMCAQTTRLDLVRKQQATAATDTLDTIERTAPAQHDVEDEVVQRVDSTAFWRLAQEHLTDERDRLTFYLSYLIGLTPRDISARHPQWFPTVRDVYRRKRAILDRLRQVAELREWL